MALPFLGKKKGARAVKDLAKKESQARKLLEEIKKELPLEEKFLQILDKEISQFKSDFDRIAGLIPTLPRVFNNKNMFQQHSEEVTDYLIKFKARLIHLTKDLPDSELKALLQVLANDLKKIYDYFTDLVKLESPQKMFSFYKKYLMSLLQDVNQLFDGIKPLIISREREDITFSQQLDDFVQAKNLAKKKAA